MISGHVLFDQPSFRKKFAKYYPFPINHNFLRASVLGSRLTPVFVRLEGLFSKRSILISHWRAIFFPNHRLASVMGALNGNTIREQSVSKPPFHREVRHLQVVGIVV